MVKAILDTHEDGVVVSISAAGFDVYRTVLETFKKQVPVEHRIWLNEHRGYLVNKRGVTALRRWLDWLRESKCEIVNEEVLIPKRSRSRRYRTARIGRSII